MACRYAQSNQPALQTCVGRLPPGPPYENSPNAPLSCKQVTGPGGFPFIRCDNYVPQFQGTPQTAAASRYGITPDAAGAAGVLYRKKQVAGPNFTAESRRKKRKPTQHAGEHALIRTVVGLSVVAVIAAILYASLTHLRHAAVR